MPLHFRFLLGYFLYLHFQTVRGRCRGGRDKIKKKMLIKAFKTRGSYHYIVPLNLNLFTGQFLALQLEAAEQAGQVIRVSLSKEKLMRDLKEMDEN